jgi:hypothetical protein
MLIWFNKKNFKMQQLYTFQGICGIVIISDLNFNFALVRKFQIQNTLHLILDFKPTYLPFFRFSFEFFCPWSLMKKILWLGNGLVWTRNTDYILDLYDFWTSFTLYLSWWYKNLTFKCTCRQTLTARGPIFASPSLTFIMNKL